MTLSDIPEFVLTVVFVGSCMLHKFIIESTGKPSRITDWLAVLLFVQLGYLLWRIFHAA